MTRKHFETCRTRNGFNIKTMTLKQIMLLVYLILLLTMELAIAIERIKYTVTHQHKCLESDALINFLLKISLYQCVRECSLRPNCLSINYRRSKLLCELYSEDDGIFVENNVNTGPCVFVRKATFEPQTPAACMSCNGWETCDPESNETPCGIIECQKLMLPFGNLRGNLRTVGSRVKFSCNGNYIEVENMVYTTCEENGRWSYVPRCITASCSDATPYYSMENVAFGKPVTLSTTHVNYLTQPHEGSLMVDGNIDQNILSCAHTLNEDLNDIITLDLGQSYTIYALRIYNRLEDCCVDWLSDVKISIGDSLDDMQLHVYHMGPVGTICSFVTVQPCTGRYIEITRNENVNPLVICELQVYGEIIAQQGHSGIIAPYND